MESGHAAEIRRAGPADAASVAALVDRAYGPYVERFGFVPGPMETDYDAAVRDAEVWVLGEGEMVAAIVLEPRPDHLWVDNVAVDPEAQGRGAGKRLLAFAEARAAELGLPELRLLTHELMKENREMYPRLGWEDVGIKEMGGHRLAHFRKPVASGRG